MKLQSIAITHVTFFSEGGHFGILLAGLNLTNKTFHSSSVRNSAGNSPTTVLDTKVSQYILQATMPAAPLLARTRFHAVCKLS
ncbi:MAG: hypothetical protein QM504_03970 [Pseudomonadota bacterium]